jgi:hypothetical protein
VKAISPDVEFAVEKAEALQFGAAPHIIFKLRISNSTSAGIHTIILRCQITLDVARRRYSPEEQQRITDLFGEPSRWGETLRPVLWANTSTIVPGFEQTTVTDLQVPCTFDFNVGSTKYFAGIESGDIPISFYFSGTIFYAGERNMLQVVQIPWEKETSFRMPVKVWREMMDTYYPNTVWVCLHRDTFDEFYAYKMKRGIPTFDQALIQAIEASKAPL